MLTTTRSVRKRLDLDRPVEPDDIRECLEIALQAPSGSNQQSWQFVVVTDAGQRGALADVYRRSFEVYRSGASNSTRLFTEDPKRARDQRRLFESAEFLAENLHRVPCMVVPVLRGRCEKLTTAHQQAIYWAGIAPAMWSFMLAARERGIGSSLTTMHLRYEQEVADILGIPFDRYTQAALIPIAYTKGTDFRRGVRQPLDEILHWDRW